MASFCDLRPIGRLTKLEEKDVLLIVEKTKQNLCATKTFGRTPKIRKKLIKQT